MRFPPSTKLKQQHALSSRHAKVTVWRVDRIHACCHLAAQLASGSTIAIILHTSSMTICYSACQVKVAMTIICEHSFLPSEVDSSTVCYSAAIAFHVQERAVLTAYVHKLQEQPAVVGGMH